MPQLFNNAVLTDKGAKLLVRAQAVEIKLEHIQHQKKRCSHCRRQQNLKHRKTLMRYQE